MDLFILRNSVVIVLFLWCFTIWSKLKLFQIFWLTWKELTDRNNVSKSKESKKMRRKNFRFTIFLRFPKRKFLNSMFINIYWDSWTFTKKMEDISRKDMQFLLISQRNLWNKIRYLQLKILLINLIIQEDGEFHIKERLWEKSKVQSKSWSLLKSTASEVYSFDNSPLYHYLN